MQDHTGQLWAGTDAGLARIVDEHLRPVQTGIPMTFVDTIVEQGDSLLWLGCAEGLVAYAFRTNTFQQIELPDKTAGRISAVVPDSSGTVWVGREKSIIRIANHRAASYMRTPKTYPDIEHQLAHWYIKRGYVSVYVYRLTAGSFVQSRKMLLVR